MIKANVISSFIFIQAHKVNMGKNSQLFLDAFLNLHFSAVLKKHFHALLVRKSMQSLWWMQSQDIPSPPLSYPHPGTHSYPMTSACSQGGVCKQSLAREALGSLRCQCFGCMRAAGSKVEQPQKSAGREGAGNGINCSVCCRPLACHTFYFLNLHFLWLKMEKQKLCPDFCLY